MQSLRHFKWWHKFRIDVLFTSLAVTKSGVLASLICIFGMLLQIRLSGKIIFQLADAFGFVVILTNFLLISTLAFCVGLTLVDLFSGAVVYIPVTIFICFLMICVIRGGAKICQQSWFMVLILLIASNLILFYVPYTLLLFGSAQASIELVTDIFQSSFTFIISVILYWWLKKIHHSKRILII